MKALMHSQEMEQGSPVWVITGDDDSGSCIKSNDHEGARVAGQGASFASSVKRGVEKGCSQIWG